MAFLSDSVLAFILFAAAMLSWRMVRATPSSARINLRFAATLMAALAVARLAPDSDLVPAVAHLVCGLAAVAAMLAYCFPRRAPSGLSAAMLVLALAIGMAAMLSPRAAALAPACQAGAALVILASASSRFYDSPRSSLLGAVGAFCLFLGAMAMLHGSRDAAMLFFTMTLLGIGRALQIPVAEARRRWLPVVSGERV